MAYLEKIIGKIPNTNSLLDIPLNGKSLVITGKNGSGKTHFLNSLNLALNNINTNNNNYTAITNDIERLLNSTTSIELFPGARETRLKNLLEQKKALENQITPILKHQTERPDAPPFERLHLAAMRNVSINKPAHISGIKSGFKSTNHTFGGITHVSNTLEQHIINLAARRAMMHSYPDDALAASIERFLNQLETNIKLLMEDDTTHLFYDIDDISVTIKRTGKPDTSFQTLSSGYSAFFAYYSELILKAEYRNILPEELTGTVLIDELEVHLHISLQRFILPFLMRSFPNIQFIITTHSPFILTSSSDIVIYDISSNSIVEEDITLFSYTSIIEGLLGTKTKSIVLDDTINEILNELKSENLDIEYTKSLLKKLEGSIGNLDAKSKVVYQTAINAIQDQEQSDV